LFVLPQRLRGAGEEPHTAGAAWECKGSKIPTKWKHYLTPPPFAIFFFCFRQTPRPPGLCGQSCVGRFCRGGKGSSKGVPKHAKDLGDRDQVFWKQYCWVPTEVVRGPRKKKNPLWLPHRIFFLFFVFCFPCEE